MFLYYIVTRSSATAEGPCDALC